MANASILFIGDSQTRVFFWPGSPNSPEDFFNRFRIPVFYNHVFFQHTAPLVVWSRNVPFDIRLISLLNGLIYFYFHTCKSSGYSFSSLQYYSLVSFPHHSFLNKLLDDKITGNPKTREPGHKTREPDYKPASLFFSLWCLETQFLVEKHCPYFWFKINLGRIFFTVWRHRFTPNHTHSVKTRSGSPPRKAKYNARRPAYKKGWFSRRVGGGEDASEINSQLSQRDDAIGVPESTAQSTTNQPFCGMVWKVPPSGFYFFWHMEYDIYITQLNMRRNTDAFPSMHMGPDLKLYGIWTNCSNGANKLWAIDGVAWGVQTMTRRNVEAGLLLPPNWWWISFNCMFFILNVLYFSPRCVSLFRIEILPSKI